MSFWRHGVDAWIRRHARPDAAALSAISGLRPGVVVTGGSKGIGLELARQFAAGGDCDLFLVARDAGSLDKARASVCEGARGRVLTLVCDVTRADAAKLIDAALAAEGCYLDVLVNSAGIGLSGAFIDHDPAEIEHLLALNTVALTRLMRHALPAMAARGRGGVLNVASLGGYVPGPNQAAYYASKAYVISLSEAVAAEMAGQGLRVAVLAPGPVETGFHAAMQAEESLYRLLLPSQSPQQVARAGHRGFVFGRSVIVPGIFNTMMAAAMRVLPRVAVVPIVRWLLAPRRTRRSPDGH